MKLISWNMAAASPRISKSRLEESWQYLLSLDPDIALVQEALIPNRVSEQYNVKWVPAYVNRSWGSAVITKFPIKSSLDIAALEPALEKIILQFKGQVVGVVVELPGWERVAVISVHSPARTIPASEIPPDILPSIKLKLNTKIWRADVIYGALRQLPLSDRHFIFGGDWNTSRLFDKLHGPRGNQEFFDRMEEAGFTECFRRYYPEEVQTWFRKGDAPFQLDHIFCDKEQASYIRYCTVDSMPAREGLSDHAMLIVEFNDMVKK